MFKRRVEDSGKCPVWRFAFRIFYAHIANVIIMRVPVEWHRDYPFFEDHMRGTGQADIFHHLAGIDFQ